ncbi:hypothetical protein JMN32_06785 [Fulvivirga sp. 29W222]|uniref:Uncharacterized protein n=1 Tax=Fulvivirga marina TaxID=2494733 RepID=A0A937FWL5_9BACT|nr:hypothetical protein [Fulvivirga marina]MBL6446007.1 hypothetical protein [Fulvivirga marina]
MLTEYKDVAIAIFNIMLNPFGLLLCLVLFQGDKSSFFTKVGVNTVRLNRRAYFVYLMVFAVLVLAITYGIGYFTSADFDVCEVYQPKYYWLSFIGWGVTVFTLYGYFHGMEGNIMGFIYFPLLFISSFGLFVVNIADIFSFATHINTPPVSAKYFWLGFAGHVFMPFQALLFTNLIKEGDEKKEWSVPIVAGLLYQMILFGLNWIIVKLFGNGVTFAEFFGEGQDLLYFIPMVGGFFYYLFYFVRTKNETGDRTLVGWFVYALTLATILLVFLQAFNYIHMFGQWF